MSEPLSIGAIVEAIEKLFGKVGAAALIASSAFFLLPTRLLAVAGLDNTDKPLRHVMGIVLLLSLAACIVAVALLLWPPITRWYSKRSESTAIDRQYFRLSPKARVLMALFELSGENRIYALLDDEAAQDLLDAKLLVVDGKAGPVLELAKSIQGIRFVSAHRPKFRTELDLDQELTEEVVRELTKASSQIGYRI